MLKTHPNAVIDLDIPEVGKRPVMISQVQRDPINGDVVHLDLHQINLDEPVRTAVALEFTGEPADVKEGESCKFKRRNWRSDVCRIDCLSS
ncbi:hypothetical protein P7H19_03220 [Paenibacillus larvae]|nr:hypothetical protein [Paenibacillus larvae]MDT2235558.1 hypothetical protein [Paenibacillus larvae]